MISPDEIRETTEIILLVEDKLKIKAQGAHQTIDVGLADKVVARNLSVRLRTPLLIVHREYFTRTSSLLFLAKTYYRPDRYRVPDRSHTDVIADLLPTPRGSREIIAPTEG